MYLSSNFKKLIIIIAAVSVVLFFLWIGAKFFLKERSSGTPVKNNKRMEKEIKKEPENFAETEATEKEKIKIFAENFAVIYYSYVWGDLSNIETQYEYMSEKMKTEEKNKVEQIKQATGNQPRKYLSARAKLTDSAILSYNENTAEVAIGLDITNFAGAIVQKKIMTWVDERGNSFMGNTADLITGSEIKKIRINLIRADDGWKVNEIENIKE